MNRTDTRRMLQLERNRDAVADACEARGQRGAMDAWRAIHGNELERLQAQEYAEWQAERAAVSAFACSVAHR